MLRSIVGQQSSVLSQKEGMLRRNAVVLTPFVHQLPEVRGHLHSELEHRGAILSLGHDLGINLLDASADNLRLWTGRSGKASMPFFMSSPLNLIMIMIASICLLMDMHFPFNRLLHRNLDHLADDLCLILLINRYTNIRTARIGSRCLMFVKTANRNFNSSITTIQSHLRELTLQPDFFYFVVALCSLQKLASGAPLLAVGLHVFQSHPQHLTATTVTAGLINMRRGQLTC
mmetsp:Transcript_20171/g.50372  ORF Transcript_20171/g.50372 Transcript_20171/m.50372 type:complete len:231 (-) Transcript_20171:61-753(-)